MDPKMPIAAGAAFVVMVGLTFLFHNILAPGWLAEGNPGVYRTSGPVTWAILSQYGILAFLMAFLFPRGFRRGNPLKDGIRFGLIIGVLVYMTQGFQLFGQVNISFTKSILHSAWHVFETMAGAVAMSFAYGDSSSSSM